MFGIKRWKCEADACSARERSELIRKLVVQGSDFVKQNDMVTIPEPADETWRMIMMTPPRQLVNPFFTGGNQISVSYPNGYDDL
jgi:hypothetical protein